jgi:hypothetical protein
MAKLGFIFWNHGAKIRHGTHRTGAEHVVRALGAFGESRKPYVLAYCRELAAPPGQQPMQVCLAQDLPDGLICGLREMPEAGLTILRLH